jgi:hypothetical protein
MKPAFFVDLVLLIAAMIVLAVVLFGWGNLAWRLFGFTSLARMSSVTLWLGYCILLCVLELIHFFVPLAAYVTITITVVGFFGAYKWFRDSWVSNISMASGPSHAVASNKVFRYLVFCYAHWLRISIVAIVVACWCIRAMEVPTMYDSGLYHFGSIRWLNEYPIVPGLGNLHWRLALNQSYFAYLAVLNIAPFWGKGYAAGGLFLLLLTAATILEMAVRASWLWRWIFAGTLVSYLFLLSGAIANPLPDTAITLIEIVIFLFLYRLLTATSEDRSEAGRLQVLLPLLCIAIVTIKLSSIVFAATSFVVVMLNIYKSSFLNKSTFLRLWVALTVILTIHVVRGYLLSGAPFFPNPTAGLWTLPWAVPPGVAQTESELIYAWAKQPGIQSIADRIPNFGWLPSWLESIPATVKFLFGTSTIMFGLGLLCCVFLDQEKSDRHFKFLLFPILFSFVFWFFTAPDVRFLGAVLVLYFVWSVWFLVISLKKRLPSIERFEKKGYRRSLNFSLSLVVIVLFVRWSAKGVTELDGWKPVPSPQVEKQTSRLGFVAFVPTQDSRCWGATLPCAVVLQDNLQSRLLPISAWMSFSPTQRFMLQAK